MTGRERAAATTVHGLLYAVMIGLPLTGWMEVSASPMNRPMLLYELLPWPQVPFVRDLPLDVRKPLAARLLIGHVWLAWSGLTLIALHVAAALKHQFWDRDQVLTRMLPRLRAAAGADQ
jgi:cytochrome b561